ncbi:MAG: hypothetical protein IT310_05010 [Anaerolineales bacterium]|nr:hypothetical protein [Anaerolineales bacterium]
MNLRYLTLRLFRHFMPEGLARFLLKQRIIIRPGLESSAPFAAVDQYLQVLTSRQLSIQGKRILLFGYGGRFAVGVELLKRGAAHVTLCDHFVLLDQARNLELLPEYAQYLTLKNGQVEPKSEYITLLHGDIREEQIQAQISQVDYALSTSVFEHLDDVDGLTAALAKLTAEDGAQLHFVDLRDHYFKYPFEMLKFSQKIWKNFLNPTSNLNRLRLGEYRKIFEACFKEVELTVTQRNEVEFQRALPAIRPEFLTGDVSIDAVELIYVVAKFPKAHRDA